MQVCCALKCWTCFRIHSVMSARSLCALDNVLGKYTGSGSDCLAVMSDLFKNNGHVDKLDRVSVCSCW